MTPRLERRYSRHSIPVEVSKEWIFTSKVHMSHIMCLTMHYRGWEHYRLNIQIPCWFESQIGHSNLAWSVISGKQIHTYITGHYNPLVRLISHTTYVVCINFMFIYRFLRNFFHVKFGFTPRVLARNLLRESLPKQYFFIFRLVGDVWSGVGNKVSTYETKATSCFCK